MNTKSSIAAVVVGLVIGAVVASIMTFLDWRLNPGGIFQTAEGTAWDKVYATFSSWFLPLSVFASLLMVSLLVAVTWAKKR